MNQIQPNSELIERVISQERKAQFQLFESTKRIVYSLAYRILNDEDLAHDVLQDTYVEVFQQIRSLKQPEALIAWMKTITVRKAIKAGKKLFEFDHLDQSQDPPDNQFDSWFDGDLLDQAIRSLPPGARAVFMLTMVEGFSHKETAQLLGISESTSKSQVNYAKKLLRNRIQTLLRV